MSKHALMTPQGPPEGSFKRTSTWASRMLNQHALNQEIKAYAAVNTLGKKCTRDMNSPQGSQPRPKFSEKEFELAQRRATICQFLHNVFKSI